jgi:hypothetical protein
MAPCMKPAQNAWGDTRAWAEARHDARLHIRVVSRIGNDEQTVGVVVSLEQAWVIIAAGLRTCLAATVPVIVATTVTTS